MLGFTADGSVENFKRRRQTELKHGRIAMLATMGYITPEQLVADLRPLLFCHLFVKCRWTTHAGTLVCSAVIKQVM